MNYNLLSTVQQTNIRSVLAAVVCSSSGGGGSGGGTWGSITGTLSNQTDLQNALNDKVSLITVQTANTVFAGPTTGSAAAPTFRALVAADIPLGVTNSQSGDYTLVLADVSKRVEMTSASSNNLTVPLNATVAFAVNTIIEVYQYGAGLTSIVATGGVTIRSSSGILTSPGQYSSMFLIKRATDEWELFNGTTLADAGITYAKIQNVAGLSVFGRSASSSGVGADITGSDGQVLRVSGTTLGFGTTAVAGGGTGLTSYTTGDLIYASSSSALSKLAIGTSGYILTVSGGLPVWAAAPTSGWALTGTSTLTGVATITSNVANQHVFTGTWTASANNQYHMNFAGTLTSTSTSSDIIYGYRFTPAFTLSQSSQQAIGVHIIPTFSGGTSPVYTALKVTGHSSSSTHVGFRVEDSANANIFQITTDGTITCKTGGGAITIGIVNSSVYTRVSNNAAMTFNLPTNDSDGITFRGNAGGTVAISHNVVVITSGITTGVGTWTFNALKLAPVINQTGSSTSTITGVYYNPTLTSVTGVTHYGIVIVPTGALNGFGVSAPTAVIHTSASTTARASACFPHGTAPTAPVDGDIWTTTAGLYVRINGSTVGPLS
jgi:hypothetical protein